MQPNIYRLNYRTILSTNKSPRYIYIRIHQRRRCLLSGTWRRLDVAGWSGSVSRTETGQAGAERGGTRRGRIPSGRGRARYQETRWRRHPVRTAEVFGLRELALGGRLPFDALAELAASRFSGKGMAVLCRWSRRLRLEAVLFARGELVDDRYLDVTGLAMALVALAAARHGALALARQHDAELVAEIVLEVDQTRVRIDVFCAWI